MPSPRTTSVAAVVIGLLAALAASGRAGADGCDETDVDEMDRPDPATDPPGPLEVNRLDNQALVREYEREWHRWE